MFEREQRLAAFDDAPIEQSEVIDHDIDGRGSPHAVCGPLARMQRQCHHKACTRAFSMRSVREAASSMWFDGELGDKDLAASADH